jgi:tetratricopeptide (TPR) repeat protein
LQDDPQVDKPTWALANFYLGIAYQHSQPPQLNEAIAAYSEAVAAWPQMITSRLNRSAAYAARHQADDLQLALADADQVIAVKPEWAIAYNNRGSIRLSMGGSENLALALTDLNKALALDAALPEAYLNRAYIHFYQGWPMERIASDLAEALVLYPNYANALNMLCWGYAIEQQPELALPYCQRAVAADPEPVFFESRGLTYALLGKYPNAIADFEIYNAWLEQQPGESSQVSLTRHQAWIQTLKAGQNPFTPAVLAKLRREFGQ